MGGYSRMPEGIEGAIRLTVLGGGEVGGLRCELEENDDADARLKPCCIESQCLLDLPRIDIVLTDFDGASMCNMLLTRPRSRSWGRDVLAGAVLESSESPDGKANMGRSTSLIGALLFRRINEVTRCLIFPGLFLLDSLFGDAFGSTKCSKVLFELRADPPSLPEPWPCG